MGEGNTGTAAGDQTMTLQHPESAMQVIGEEAAEAAGLPVAQGQAGGVEYGPSAMSWASQNSMDRAAARKRLASNPSGGPDAHGLSHDTLGETLPRAIWVVWAEPHHHTEGSSCQGSPFRPNPPLSRPDCQRQLNADWSRPSTQSCRLCLKTPRCGPSFPTKLTLGPFSACVSRP